MVPAGEEATEWDKTNVADSAWLRWAIQGRDWQHSQQLPPAARAASSSECPSAQGTFLRVIRDLNGPRSHSVWGGHHTLWQPTASVMFCMHLILCLRISKWCWRITGCTPLTWVCFLLHPAPQPVARKCCRLLLVSYIETLSKTKWFQWIHWGFVLYYIILGNLRWED